MSSAPHHDPFGDAVTADRDLSERCILFVEGTLEFATRSLDTLAETPDPEARARRGTRVRAFCDVVVLRLKPG